MNQQYQTNFSLSFYVSTRLWLIKFFKSHFLIELFSIPTISFLTKKKKRKRKWRLQLVAYQSWLSLYYSPLFSTMFLMQIKPLLKAFATWWGTKIFALKNYFQTHRVFHLIYLCWELLLLIWTWKYSKKPKVKSKIFLEHSKTHWISLDLQIAKPIWLTHVRQ